MFRETLLRSPKNKRTGIKNSINRISNSLTNTVEFGAIVICPKNTVSFDFVFFFGLTTCIQLDEIRFTIHGSPDGDVYDGIEFGQIKNNDVLYDESENINYNISDEDDQKKEQLSDDNIKPRNLLKSKKSVPIQSPKSKSKTKPKQQIQIHRRSQTQSQSQLIANTHVNNSITNNDHNKHHKNKNKASKQRARVSNELPVVVVKDDKKEMVEQDNILLIEHNSNDDAKSQASDLASTVTVDDSNANGNQSSGSDSNSTDEMHSNEKSGLRRKSGLFGTMSHSGFIQRGVRGNKHPNDKNEYNYDNIPPMPKKSTLTQKKDIPRIENYSKVDSSSPPYLWSPRHGRSVNIPIGQNGYLAARSHSYLGRPNINGKVSHAATRLTMTRRVRQLKQTRKNESQKGNEKREKKEQKEKKEDNNKLKRKYSLSLSLTRSLRSLMNSHRDSRSIDEAIRQQKQNKRKNKNKSKSKSKNKYKNKNKNTNKDKNKHKNKHKNRSKHKYNNKKNKHDKRKHKNKHKNKHERKNEHHRSRHEKHNSNPNYNQSKYKYVGRRHSHGPDTRNNININNDIRIKGDYGYNISPDYGLRFNQNSIGDPINSAIYAQSNIANVSNIANIANMGNGNGTNMASIGNIAQIANAAIIGNDLTLLAPVNGYSHPPTQNIHGYSNSAYPTFAGTISGIIPNGGAIVNNVNVNGNVATVNNNVNNGVGQWILPTPRVAVPSQPYVTFGSSGVTMNDQMSDKMANINMQRNDNDNTNGNVIGVVGGSNGINFVAQYNGANGETTVPPGNKAK